MATMSTVADAPSRPARATTSNRLTYLPGLDGLRAISVVAVLLYHADLDWIPGGFLGVEVFFVISGYLITLLMLNERESTGALDMRHFWLRRARRLLPALYALLAGVAVYSVFFLRENLAKLRDDILAAFFYVTNWYLIFSQTSYFDRLGRPSMLRHLWSLAVEEQFYLLWPIAMWAMLRFFRARVQPMAIMMASGVLASTILMAVLYHPGKEPSRVYFGTDTRAAGLLAGALLALFWRPEKLRDARMRQHAPLVQLAGVAALVGLAAFFLRAQELDSFLYRGGFLVLSVVTVVAIAAATAPKSALGAVLGIRPLRWIGLRSYGLYLYHWPIYMVTRPGIDVSWSPNTALAVRLGLTAVVTEVSYRWIETPVRNGALGRIAQSLRGPATERRNARRRGVAVVTGALLLVAVPVTVQIASAKETPDEIAASLRQGEAVISGALTTAAPSSSTSVLPSATTAQELPGSTLLAPTTIPTTTAPPTTPPAPPPRIFALGDSVMLGAAPQLQQTFAADIVVDAKVSRNMKLGLQIVQGLRDSGRLPQVMVIHLGNNLGIKPEAIDQMMALLSGVPKVVWINVRVPRQWEAEANNALAATVPKYGNAVLVDWKGITEGQARLFYKDGMHLRPDGARFYAATIQQAIG